MLYIVFGDEHEREWHVNKTFNLQGENLQEVTEIQAEGDELEWLKKNITGIPFCTIESIRIQRWFGDHAKFIANCIDGLPLHYRS